MKSPKPSNGSPHQKYLSDKMVHDSTKRRRERILGQKQFMQQQQRPLSSPTSTIDPPTNSSPAAGVRISNPRRIPDAPDLTDEGIKSSVGRRRRRGGGGDRRFKEGTKTATIATSIPHGGTNTSNSSNGSNSNSSDDQEEADESNTTKTTGFEINVSKESDDSKNVKVCVQGPDPKGGLPAVLLMVLAVHRWRILELVKKSMIDESALLLKQNDTEEEKQEEEATPATSSIQKDQYCFFFVVQAPPADNCSSRTRTTSNTTRSGTKSGEGGAVVLDSSLLLQNLKDQLLSTCKAFVSPLRETVLTTLIRAFVRSIDPNIQIGEILDQNHHPRSSAPGAFRVFPSTPTNCLPSGDSSFSVVVASTTGHEESSPTPDSRQQQQQQQAGQNINDNNGEDAVGRTTRTSRKNRNKPGGRTKVSSRSNSARQWISNRLRGSATNTRRSNNGETTTRLEESSPVDGDKSEVLDVPIAAEVVEEGDKTADLEAEIREKIMMEAATASVMPQEDIEDSKKQRKWLIRVTICACILAAMVIILVVAFVVVGSRKVNDAAPPPNNMPDSPGTSPTSDSNMTLSPTPVAMTTLEKIRNRGNIICSTTTTSNIGTLEMNLCKALNAAIFGNLTTEVEYVSVMSATDGGFQELNEDVMDVLIQSRVSSSSQSIQEMNTGESFAFSSPYYYDGLVFGGLPDFVECADKLDSYFGICRRLVICIHQDVPTHLDFLESRIPAQNLKVVDDFENVIETGICNVIGDRTSQIDESLDLASGPSSSFGGNSLLEIGSNVFTKDPLAMVTRAEDFAWTAFVETVLQGLLEAEARGITMLTASEFPSVPYFGTASEDMISQAVANVGNFGDISADLPRMGFNQIRMNCVGGEEAGGLIYGFPFGEPLTGEFPLLDQIIESLVEEDQFRCGIFGLEDSSILFHLELCKAVSAALNVGSTDKFEAITVTPNATEWSQALLDGQIDVVMGVASSSLPELGEQLPLLFLSKPYLFDGTQQDMMRFGGIEAMVFASSAVSDPDFQWSAFVQWVIMSLILAEENFITQATVSSLPVDVMMFGPRFDAMFRDIILAVGNYGEIFERTITMPRSGCNRLNRGDPPGPQLFPFLFQGL